MKSKILQTVTLTALLVVGSIFVPQVGESNISDTEVVEMADASSVRAGFAEDIINANNDVVVVDEQHDEVAASLEETEVEETTEIEEVTEVEEESETEEPVEEIWQYGWTNTSSNVRKAPSLDAEIYTVYSFNSCVYYTPYNSEWVKIVYYDSVSGAEVDAYISASLISNEECQVAKNATGNPKDMIGTGRYLVGATGYYDKYNTGSSASGVRLTAGYSVAGAICWLGHYCDIYSEDGTYLGTYKFEDTGYGKSTGWGSSSMLSGKSVGSIEAGLDIDIYFNTYSDCANWGRRNVYIEIY